MHKEHNNSLFPKTIVVIAVRFLNLHKGKRVVRNNCIIPPIPAKVISTIHQLAASG